VLVVNLYILPMEYSLLSHVQEYLGDWFSLVPEIKDDFERVNPKTPTQLLAFYKFTHSYLKPNSIHDVPDEIVTWTQTNKGSRVLDFGGGAGNVAVFLGRMEYFVDYLDINLMQRDFVQWLRDKKLKIPEYHLRIIDKPEFAKEYDLLVLRDVVEHLEDYSNTIAPLLQTVRPKGYVFAKPEFAGTSQGMAIHFHDKRSNGFSGLMKASGFTLRSRYMWQKD
jgi:cyclopropane fatty-acyl-phospholipid synthase-like methyltransferase